MNDDIMSLKQELDLNKQNLQVIMDKLEDVGNSRRKYISMRDSIAEREKKLKDAKDFMEIYSLLIRGEWTFLALGLLTSFLKVIGIVIPILTNSFIPAIFTILGASGVIIFPIAYHKQKMDSKKILKNYKGQNDEYSLQDLDSKIEELDAHYIILDNQKEKLIDEQRDIREFIRLRNINALTKDTMAKDDKIDPPKVKIKK